MEKAKKSDLRLRQVCTNCAGYGRPLKRVWGYPSKLALKHEQEGRITLAGCMVSIDNAQYECRHCGDDWRIM